MRTIDITTTQNVTIKYDLAGLRDRFFAWFIDFVIMVAGFWLLYLLFLLAFGGGGINFFTYFVGYPIMFFYTLTWETLADGQTPGKMALGIKVVKVNGKVPNLNDYILRWVFRGIDIYFSVGALGSIFINSSEKEQRLGDLVANTAVIRIRPTMKMSLSDILRINSREDYEPVYPQVRQLSEQDMLMVKKVMERAKKYPNPAHKKAIEQLTGRLCELLDIAPKPKEQSKFLRTLIKDYIVLTR